VFVSEPEVRSTRGSLKGFSVFVSEPEVQSTRGSLKGFSETMLLSCVMYNFEHCGISINIHVVRNGVSCSEGEPSVS